MTLLFITSFVFNAGFILLQAGFFKFFYFS